jgi:hypothetical protein
MLRAVQPPAPGFLRRAASLLARWSVDYGVPVMAFGPLAVLLSWSLFAVPGMPLTHDGLGLAFVEAYRRSYRGGDYFPLWTPFAEAGHGSAFPILYHRLHAQVFGLLAVKLGSLIALKVSIPMLLVVGAVGMRRLGLAMGVRPWLAWIAGVLLMAAPYVVTDWFVRGATAEFTAFMLVPWCLREALRAFDDDWGPVRLAVASALLFYAHMMTFYVFVLVAFVVIAGSLLGRRAFGWPGLRPAIRRGAVFVALLTCAIGPYAAAVKYAVAFSGLNKLEMRGDDEAYYPLTSFFADPNFSWSRAQYSGDVSVEIGRWALLCLGVALLVEPAARTALRRVLGLVVLAIAFLGLQRKEMSFVFGDVPGAAAIQLPTRLLVYIVPIVLLCMAMALEQALRSKRPWVRAVALVMPAVAAAGQVTLAASTQRAIWGQQVARSDIDQAMDNEQDVTTGKMAVYSAWHLFAPKRQGSPPAAPFLEAKGDCAISSPGLMDVESTQVVASNVPVSPVSLTVHGHDCSVTSNQYQSSLLRADFSGPGELRSADDGTTILVVPDGGTRVRLRERGVLDLAGKWVIEKLSRRP